MEGEQVTSEQEAHRLSKNAKWLALLFAFICTNTSLALFVAIAVFRRKADCPDCTQFSPTLLPMLIILATLLLFLGVGILTSLCLRQARSLTRTPQDIISSRIPVGDLEKSPAPILPYNHVPHGEPFIESSSINLPDYFTAIRKIGEIDVRVDADLWTEAGDPEIESPPCYEQALEMAATLDSPERGVKPTSSPSKEMMGR